MRKLKTKLVLSVIATLSLCAPVQAEITFSDVTPTDWYYNSVEWGTEKGFISGFPDGTFRPHDRVTEAEFISMLSSLYPSPEPIEIAPDGHWADLHYLRAKWLNYPVYGKDDYKYRSKHINRQQVADILAGSLGANYERDLSVHLIMKEGIAKGKIAHPNKVVAYQASDYVTRAEAVQLIQNAVGKGLTKLRTRPKNPGYDFLIPAHPESDAYLQSFLDTIKYDAASRKITVTIPKNPPGGYTVHGGYMDWAGLEHEVDFDDIPLGTTRTVHHTDKGGWVHLLVRKDGRNFNSVSMSFPSKEVKWSTRGHE